MGKTIEIVAGPNGSGKTTFSNVYLLGKLGRSVYLNPDLIASGISPIDFEKASFHAGRVLIGEVKARIARAESLAFESTLSGRTWMGILKEAIQQDYQVTIYYLYLDSVKKNLQRIKKLEKLSPKTQQEFISTFLKGFEDRSPKSRQSSGLPRSRMRRGELP